MSSSLLLLLLLLLRDSVQGQHFLTCLSLLLRLPFPVLADRSLSASRSPRRDNGHDRRKPQDRGDNRTENGGNEDVRHRREGSKGHRKEKKKKSGKKKSRKIDRDKSDKRNNRQGLDVRISPKEKRRKRERSRSCSSSSVTSSTRPVSPAHHQNASDTVKTSSGEEQAASTTATPASLTVDQRGTRENSGRDGETQPEEERASVDEDAPTPPASPGVASKKAELSVASAPSKTSFFEQLRAMEGRKGSVGTMHATGNSASVGVSGASGGGGVIQSSDWECLKCGKSNYKNASACDRCASIECP